MSKNILIFIVDDDERMRDSMTDILVAKGYEVMTAENGKEALQKIEKHPPDLIILDMIMPIMGGMELYSSLCGKDNVPRFPVFVLTGNAGLKNLFKDFFIQGFMTKPFNFDKLVHEINGIINVKNPGKVIKSRDITIIDDDPEALSKLAEMFEAAGYRTVLIPSGVAALERLYKEPEEIILIKFGLKDIPGDLIVSRLNYMAKTAHIHTFLYAPKSSQSDPKVIEFTKQKNGISEIILFNEYQEILRRVDQFILSK